MNNPLSQTNERTSPIDRITDWYIPLEKPYTGYAFPGPVEIEPNDILYPMTDELLKACKEKYLTKKDFSIRVKNTGYRGHYVSNSVDGSIFIIRKSPQVVPKMLDLRLPEVHMNILLHKKLKETGGLVIVCGETGQGKSTLCAATLLERMRMYDSFCYTIEDPPELPLSGKHGNGRCIQTELHDSDAWGEALKEAMRCYPATSGNMLFVGETRDKKGAAELLRIANNGHLVFTTMHADSVEGAIGRLKSLASDEVGVNEANQLMAASVRLVVNQRLIPMQNGTNDKFVKLSLLVSPNATSIVANKMKRGEASYGNELHQQEAKMKNDPTGNSLFAQ